MFKFSSIRPILALCFLAVSAAVGTDDKDYIIEYSIREEKRLLQLDEELFFQVPKTPKGVYEHMLVIFLCHGSQSHTTHKSYLNVYSIQVDNSAINQGTN
jgi:hypothetical protein